MRLSFLSSSSAARDQVIKYVVAILPEQVAGGRPVGRARVHAMLDNILRTHGLRSDTAISKNMERLSLGSIRAPTRVSSPRDDGYGTYTSAQETSSRIAGAKFLGFHQGGHAWVGHDAKGQAEILKLLLAQAKP